MTQAPAETQALGEAPEATKNKSSKKRRRSTSKKTGCSKCRYSIDGCAKCKQ